MSLERSWTTDMNLVNRRAPVGDLGLIPLVAIPLWTGAIAVAGALGYGTYESIFGTNQATFNEGWSVGTIFDQRMAAMHDLWIKFDQAIQLKCPGFLKKDGGKWWRQFKSDLNEFGQFYAKVGTHPGYVQGWSSSVPTGDQIGGAVARLNSLVGWGQAVEQSCPGTFPNLGVLAPSDAEQIAEAKRKADADKNPGFFSNFGSNLGVTIGLSAVGLLAFIWLAGKAERGFRGLEAVHARRIRRRVSTKRRRTR